MRSPFASPACADVPNNAGLPLRGRLENPTASHVVLDHCQLSVGGWLAHETDKIVRIDAWVHPRLPSRLRIGLPRPDVAAVFGSLPGAAHSGFEGQVFVPSSLPHPWRLEVWAETVDGVRQRAFSQVVAGPPAKEETMPSGSPAIREHRAANVSRATQSSRPPAAASVVVVNDNLILGGAALFAFEYARHLRNSLGWTVRMAAPVDGPLRELCEAGGLPVRVVSVDRLLRAATREQFFGQLRELAETVDWSSADLVIVNTFAAAWAVPLAALFGKPSLLYVHESAGIRRLFPPSDFPAMSELAAEIPGMATHTVFVTEWTRRLHAAHERNGNFRLLPSWVDLDRLDRFAAENDAGALRSRHGVAPNDFVFVCLGGICDRKGQRLLIRAVQWLQSETPLRRISVLMVGARPTPDTRHLLHEIAELEIANVRVVPETPAALEYLWLADAYVCPSFEEGFPRSLLEAAAFGKPIVTSRIQGIPEMLNEQEAWFVPPGDPQALAEAMGEVVVAIRRGDFRRPHAARHRIENCFSAAESLPRHAALACETLEAALTT